MRRSRCVSPAASLSSSHSPRAESPTSVPRTVSRSTASSSPTVQTGVDALGVCLNRIGVTRAVLGGTRACQGSHQPPDHLIPGPLPSSPSPCPLSASPTQGDMHAIDQRPRLLFGYVVLHRAVSEVSVEGTAPEPEPEFDVPDILIPDSHQTQTLPEVWRSGRTRNQQQDTK